MSGIDIIKAFDDRRLIGGYIKEQDNSFFNWKVFFKSIYAIPMDQKERKVIGNSLSVEGLPSSRLNPSIAYQAGSRAKA